ncbi:MAG TPA: hypothetical protein VNW95_07625 [Mucilaginibacter sp.]|jgi:hypothetical protein|nr:hypothetical protein [Mucilaginibacter sp.]
MTILKITVEDEQVALLRELLKQVSFVKNIEEDYSPDAIGTSSTNPSYDRIKKLLDEARGKNLFNNIDDPSEWQRELRKEWDRDF